MISYDEASALIDRLAKPLGTETVAIARAAGRVLAEPVRAQAPSPHRAVSAMDGYAVRTADLATLPARLSLYGKSYAGGSDPGELPEGACMRIFTGAPVPRGADRVVVQEVVEEFGDHGVFASEPAEEPHVRLKGSDFAAGTCLLDRGALLGPRQLVAAAAADLSNLPCHRVPRVALLATGDELVPPGEASRRDGAVPDSLSCGLAALIAEWGGTCVASSLLADEVAAAQHLAAQGLDTADLVVVTGGASVGERDLARAMFDPFDFEPIFAKVAMKPGKPAWLGRCGTTVVMGLPGNPTSALVTARLLLAPLLAGLSGRATEVARDWRPCVLAAPLPSTGDREIFLRAKRSGERVVPLRNQQSHAQHVLAHADLLLRRSANAKPLAEGNRIAALAF